MHWHGWMMVPIVAPLVVLVVAMCEHPNPAECPNHGRKAGVSNKIGQLSIDVDGLSREAERVASDASYGGNELQVDRLLSIAGELRNLAAEIEALR